MSIMIDLGQMGMYWRGKYENLVEITECKGIGTFLSLKQFIVKRGLSS